MQEYFYKMLNISSVSGNEENLSQLIKDNITQYVDEIIHDNLGNMICIKKGTGKKIMLTANMDECGIIVTHIDKKGYARFSLVGHFSLYALINQPISVNGEIGIVRYGEEGEPKDLKVSKMFIDFGFESEQDALNHINIGAIGALVPHYVQNENKIISKSFSNKVGCYILMQLAKNIKDNNNEFYFVFTTQREIGNKGAKVSAYNLEPDYCIAIDKVIVSDKDEGIKVKNGPCIKLKDKSMITHPTVRDLLLDAAKRANIKHQLLVCSESESEAGVIFTQKTGIPSGTVCVPVVNHRTNYEMYFEEDIDKTVKLLQGIV